TAQWGPFTSTQAVGDYLGSTGTAGTTITAPIPLTVKIPNSDWGNLLTTLGNKNKYVNLDLSDSTLGTTFNPGSANTGEQRIVSLVLPNDATSIQGSASDSEPTFRFFTALKDIGGAYIETIGGRAFRNCPALMTASFPMARTIGEFAFTDCSSLISVSLPQAITLERAVFQRCIALKSVNLSNASVIDYYAFSETGPVELTITLGVTPPSFGSNPFADVNTAKTVILKVPSSALTSYQSNTTWKNEFTGGNSSITLSIQAY
ncbi:MAG: leucine-rich repeat domain-containing protein, partial [Treponema sp.]|nr:leucine-rich repeat domain-containing protein [Treponema sp.]